MQASSGTTSIHYQSPFTLKAIQIRIILTRNDMFTHDCDIYCECACGCDVSACVAGNKRISSESARRETVRAGHAKNRLILITGRSISASLFYSSLILMMSNPLQGSRLTFFLRCTGTKVRCTQIFISAILTSKRLTNNLVNIKFFIWSTILQER